MRISMSKTQPAPFQITRNFNDLMEGDVAEFPDGAEPPKIFLEIARPYSGPRPTNGVKRLNPAYFAQFSCPEVIKKPAREAVTYAELLERFGWSDTQFERAVAYGLPRILGRRGRWHGLRYVQTPVFDLDAIENWWQELAGFVGSTRIEN